MYFALSFLHDYRFFMSLVTAILGCLGYTAESPLYDGQRSVYTVAPLALGVDAQSPRLVHCS